MQFTDLVPLVEAKQALLFINQHRENAFCWVAASGIEDGASTDKTIEIPIRRSQSLQITLHGHSTFHTPWKNPMTSSAGVGFAAACVLGFYVGWLFPPLLSFGTSFFELPEKTVMYQSTLI